MRGYVDAMLVRLPSFIGLETRTVRLRTDAIRFANPHRSLRVARVLGPLCFQGYTNYRIGGWEDGWKTRDARLEAYLARPGNACDAARPYVVFDMSGWFSTDK